MKLVVLTQNRKRLLIETDEVPNYKQLYLQEDGSPFSTVEIFDLSEVKEEPVSEVAEEVAQVEEPKVVVKKAKKGRPKKS